MPTRLINAIEEAVSEVIGGEDIVTAVNNACFNNLVRGDDECNTVYEAVAEEVGISAVRG